jgi:hypothetical protein
LWFFTRNTPQIFAPPSKIGKNMIFLRKIVIFHTKYPKIFAPPSARRNFFYPKMSVKMNSLLCSWVVLFLSINPTSGHFCYVDVIWWFYFPNAGFSRTKSKIGDVIIN